jgi:FG-GAP-like repeat
VSYPSYDIPEPVDVADLVLDGRADVVTLHGGWNDGGVYRGQAGGMLGAEELFPLPYASHYNPHGLAVGDINGDGTPDVVLADDNNGLVVLRDTTTPSLPPAVPTLTAAVSTSNSSTSPGHRDRRTAAHQRATRSTAGLRAAAGRFSSLSAARCRTSIRRQRRERRTTTRSRRTTRWERAHPRTNVVRL